MKQTRLWKAVLALFMAMSLIAACSDETPETIVAVEEEKEETYYAYALQIKARSGTKLSDNYILLNTAEHKLYSFHEN